MKPGAILVNTARGDEKYLIEALGNGSPLIGLPNVVAAPHLAWLTQEMLARSIAAAHRNVYNWRNSLPPENRMA